MVCEPVYFAAEPLAAFSFAPQTSREPLANRSFNRGRQSIWRRLMNAHGRELVDEACGLARTPEMREQVEVALCDALALSYLSVSRWRLKQVCKGIAKMAITRDPLSKFWRVAKDTVFSR
jgi:hypothetical protein